MKIRSKVGLGVIALAALALVGAPSMASAAEEICTETQTHTEITYDLQRSDWVAGTPEVPAVPASIEDGWYTESDDAAPTIDGSSLVFTAPGGQAVGLRYATSFPVSELSGTSYTSLFHDRAVVDVDGTPFGNWRDDYLSLTFTSSDTVWVSGANVEMSLSDAIAAYPGTVTSFGYHMDSNAPAGTSYSVDGLVIPGTPAIPGTPDSYTEFVTQESGQATELPDGRANDEEFQIEGVGGVWRYHTTGEVEVSEEVEVECPVVEEPTPTEPTPTTDPTATPAPVAVTTTSADSGELAHTGADLTPYLVAAAILAALGLAIVIPVGVRQARNNQ